MLNNFKFKTEISFCVSFEGFCFTYWSKCRVIKKFTIVLFLSDFALVLGPVPPYEMFPLFSIFIIHIIVRRLCQIWHNLHSESTMEFHLVYICLRNLLSFFSVQLRQYVQVRFSKVNYNSLCTRAFFVLQIRNVLSFYLLLFLYLLVFT